MNSNWSILAGPNAIREVLEFVRAHPGGTAIPDLSAKYDLISNDTLLAALYQLEQDSKIKIENEHMVYPLQQ